MADHIVKQGECIISIAEEAGHFWETLWDHPENAELRAQRKDPNVLLPKDSVHMPPLRKRNESAACEDRHRYRRKGVPAKLRLRLLEEPEEEQAAPESGESMSAQDSLMVVTEDPELENQSISDKPRANVPYILEIDGVNTEGETDDDGRIEASIPPNARRAVLKLNPGTEDEEVIPIVLGALDPISETSGVKQRLANLGFECGDRSSDENDALRQVLKQFQEKSGLDPTGDLNDETRDMIESLHGS